MRIHYLINHVQKLQDFDTPQPHLLPSPNAAAALRLYRCTDFLEMALQEDEVCFREEA